MITNKEILEILKPGFALLLVVIIWAIAMLLCTGCSSPPYREFNTEDTQDQACYAKYGGLRGYCNAIKDSE